MYSTSRIASYVVGYVLRGQTGIFSVEKHVRPSSSSTFVCCTGERFPLRLIFFSSDEPELRERSRERTDFEPDDDEDDFEPDFFDLEIEPDSLDEDSLEDDDEDEVDLEADSSVDSSEDELSCEHSELLQMESKRGAWHSESVIM